ncbi:hypothetical protein TRV_07440 [Trichophyton verrucosum HKI 0517]|uniref:Uncharacterized protein n=1 Tax=Trichophyton verrucosum (strain HKI 0517) TaxID=663202 RepID=D4DJS2_TRIVH|nr:uncharacterized protein TRV_07440 [Trichophyton verrucosum HKI 0517]EFE37894.1 hypothetical protein TRV_07440 [Trichophyton verrucosum HKI 0517]
MGNFTKQVVAVIGVIIGRPADLRKFFKPTVARGKTVWPKTPADLLRYGVRWDYDGVVDHLGQQCHKYQLQPNAGKIPSTIKEWREKNGGTHAVITTMYIAVDTEPNAEIFEEAATNAINAIGTH